MRKLLVVLVGVCVYAGELILVIILLAAISSFFPEDVSSYIPESSNYVLIAIIYLIRLIALGVAIVFLRKEIIHAKKDLANAKGFWFLNR